MSGSSQIITVALTLFVAGLGFGSAIAAEYVRDRSVRKRETADRVARFQVETLTRVQEQARALMLTLIRHEFALIRRRDAESSLNELGPRDVAKDEIEELKRLGGRDDLDAVEEFEEAEKLRMVEESRERKQRLKEGIAKLERRVEATLKFNRELEGEAKSWEALVVARVELDMLATRVLNPEIAKRVRTLCLIEGEASAKTPEGAADGQEDRVESAQQLHVQLQELAGREILRRLQG